MTADHVIFDRDDGESTELILDPDLGRGLRGAVYLDVEQRQQRRDLALLSYSPLRNREPFPYLRVWNVASSGINVGDAVALIGIDHWENGTHRTRVEIGRIVTIDYPYRGSGLHIGVSSEVIHGNSGGIVVNTSCNVVGLAVSISENLFLNLRGQQTWALHASEIRRHLQEWGVLDR